MDLQRVVSTCAAFTLAALMSGINPTLSAAMGADTIIGSGKRGAVEFRFHVVVTPAGNAEGEYYEVNPGVATFRGRVDCGWVSGNIGVFGGVIDGTDDTFTIMVSDDPDGIIIGTGRPNCDTSGFGVLIPITEGEITVVDR